MNTTEPKPDDPTSSQPADALIDRKQRVENLLLTIGGTEESLRIALSHREYEIADTLKELKKNYYNKLIRFLHGYTTETAPEAEKDS